MSQNVVVENGSSTLGEDATVAPGQITVDARVSVSFALK
jgi:lipid-binding SYLF domain-containing protein